MTKFAKHFSIKQPCIKVSETIFIQYSTGQSGFFIDVVTQEAQSTYTFGKKLSMVVNRETLFVPRRRECNTIYTGGENVEDFYIFMASSRADKSRNVVKRIFNALKSFPVRALPHQFTTILTFSIPSCDLPKHFIQANLKPMMG